ncbi:hypothetical protein QJS04_geneDACA008645 [Acorus gramineus]|uniref:J domain-containing protein n=1 Tax=Acorus gramineus TaxID=55184 RepID=A0AAV9AGA5_ACOGR|nr:hypothetical protein QJS04_geneDACA008645 [Acorus gramineus]
MQIPRLKNLVSICNSISTARFHSTPISPAKWKYKWKNVEETGRLPTKNYIRYTTRIKRADAKRALKNLFFQGDSSRMSFQDNNISGRADLTDGENSMGEDDSYEQPRSKKSSGRYKGPQNRNKRKQFNNSFECDDDERVFEATFGNKTYTWSFGSSKRASSQNSTTGFEWRDTSSSKNSSAGFEWTDHSSWTNNRRKEWETSESEDDATSFIGLCSERVLLGLPSTGPLKITDVKSAFRVSALKWHPDKHQGPSQAMAEEKFKQCADAYRSLCNALNSA